MNKAEPPDDNGMFDRLFTAAKECFDRYGIDKTSMEDIAKVAGVSRPTVYRYMGDREDLITTVVTERAEAVFAQTRRMMSRHPDYADKFVEGILYLVEQGRKDPYLRWLVSPENSYLLTAQKTLDLNLVLWMPILEKARDSGVLHPDLNLHDVCVWFSQVQFIIFARANTLPAKKADLRQLLRVFVLPTLIPEKLLSRPI